MYEDKFEYNKIINGVVEKFCVRPLNKEDIEQIALARFAQEEENGNGATKEYLEEYYGVEIIMTHNGLDNNTEMSVLDRGMVARNNNADLLLCLHYNAASSGISWHGAEVYVTDNI